MKASDGVRKSSDEGETPWKRVAVAGTSGGPSPSVKDELDINKPIDRAHADAVLNFLARLACQVKKHFF